MTVVDLTAVDLEDLAIRAGEELETASAEEILRWAADTFGAGLAVASSMQDGLLPHLAARARPGIDVVFLDTGYHFVETIGTRDAVAEFTNITLLNITPRQSVAEQDAEYGPRLFERDPDRCCALRKVQPLERALAPYTAWATGLRRDESPTRADTKVVSLDAKRGKVKIAPIARWTEADVEAYIAEHGILVNPLQLDGYASIGCAPCTRRVAPGEDPRSGRWAGQRQDRMRAAHMTTTSVRLATLSPPTAAPATADTDIVTAAETPAPPCGSPGCPAPGSPRSPAPLPAGYAPPATASRSSTATRSAPT